MQTQTFNISGNQQVQFYNYNGGSDPDRQTGSSTVHSRVPTGSNQGDGSDSRILKTPLIPPLVRYGDLSGQIDTLTKDMNAVKGDVNNVSTKLDEVQSGVTNISGKFAGVERNMGQINKNIDALKTQSSQSQKDLTAIKTSLGTLGPKVDQIQTTVDDIKKNCKTCSSGSGH
jgi:outer membrane murein-binding lipoprotein Lpp